MRTTCDISQKFTKNVRYIAKSQDYPIGKLEKDVGVTVGYLSRFKNGTKSIGLDVACDIASKLNYSLEDMLTKDIRKEVLRAEIKRLQWELEKGE